jgi:hypothetical protein
MLWLIRKKCRNFPILFTHTARARPPRISGKPETKKECSVQVRLLRAQTLIPKVLFYFSNNERPAQRGRTPAKLNGKAETLCTLTDCQCDVKSSMPDGVIHIRSKIACL